jgi:hypothetical protein
MKLETKKNKIIIYINNKKDKINLINKDNLEIYFKELFIKLKENYHLELSGYFDIEVHTDNDYGVILVLEKEEYEYYEYLEDKIDMRISIKDDICFLYKMKDIIKNDKVTHYFYKNEIYVKPKKEITNIELGKIIEFADIIYGGKVKNILKFGKIIKLT